MRYAACLLVLLLTACEDTILAPGVLRIAYGIDGVLFVAESELADGGRVVTTTVRMKNFAIEPATVIFKRCRPFAVRAFRDDVNVWSADWQPPCGILQGSQVPETVHLDVRERSEISQGATVEEILDAGKHPDGQYRFDVYFDVYVRVGGNPERGVTVVLDAGTLELSLAGSS